MAYKKQIFETGDILTADNLNLMEDGIYESIIQNKNKSIASLRCVPIVTFVYDDGPNSADAKMVEELDKRGLKASFAVMGNVDPSAWTGGPTLQKWSKNGHNTLCHGVVGGASKLIDGGMGIGDMHDKDQHFVLRKNIESLKYYGLNHRGIVYFNTIAYNPHTMSILQQYYDYGIVNSGDGINDFQRSNYRLNRCNTDGVSMLSGALDAVDKSLGKPVWLMFGGHTTRTGAGATNSSYSTQEDVTTLLDYIADKVANGQMISLNADDAYDVHCARQVYFNVIRKLDSTYDLYSPMVGSVRYENGLKYCKDIGQKAVYTVEFDITGIKEGSFDFILGAKASGVDPSSKETINITTVADSTQQSIMESFLKKIYTAYTVRINKNKLYLYRDLPDETFTPYIENNTSGVVFTINCEKIGKKPTWITIGAGSGNGTLFDETITQKNSSNSESGTRLDQKIHFYYPLEKDATITVETKSLGSWTGGEVTVYANSDNTRQLGKIKLGETQEFDLLKDDTGIWFFSTGLKAINDETIQVKVTHK